MKHLSAGRSAGTRSPIGPRGKRISGRPNSSIRSMVIPQLSSGDRGYEESCDLFLLHGQFQTDTQPGKHADKGVNRK